MVIKEGLRLSYDILQTCTDVVVIYIHNYLFNIYLLVNTYVCPIQVCLFVTRKNVLRGWYSRHFLLPHCLVFSMAPTQGGGSSHVRVRIFIPPPHVLLHRPHGDHLLNSEGENMFWRISFKCVTIILRCRHHFIIVILPLCCLINTKPDQTWWIIKQTEISQENVKKNIN